MVTTHAEEEEVEEENTHNYDGLERTVMDNSATQNYEYSALLKEYSSFVQSMVVVADDRVRIVTFENQIVELQFSGAGWTVLAISTTSGPGEDREGEVQVDDVFETSEALLMSISLRFRQLWNEKLFEKLSNLQ